MSIAKISRRAKQIRKSHPGMKWQSALKKAGAEFRGKKSAPKKSTSKKRRKVGSNVTRSKAHTDYNAPEVNISIGSVEARYRKELEKKLGVLEVRKFNARLKSDKRKIAKDIAAVKSKIRNIKK